jgi:hypothetical protein
LTIVNHRQQRTAFETDTGRSAAAAGTGLPAPFRPFAEAGRIGTAGGNQSRAAY